jgi:DNA (cytosine-5)-methyltransferase 1
MDIYISSRKKLGIPPPRFGYHVNDINDFLTAPKFKELSSHINESRKEYPVIGFIGGPPCPDFSVGGKNRGKEGEHGRLSGIYTDLICNSVPDFFLFENVKGLWRTKKHRNFYESLKEKLVDSGYFLTERLINSIEYGAPQDRERIILIGFTKKFLFENKYQSNNTHFLWDFDWNYSIIYDKKRIFSLPWTKTESFEEDSSKPCSKDCPIELTIQYWFEKNDVNNHTNKNKYFTPRAGITKFKIIEEGDDSKKSYKRLHRWRYSPTAAYGNNEVHLHPYKARRISVAEALAIQSLPKDFVIPENIELDYIGRYAFYGLYNFTNLFFNSVKVIASNAFSDSYFAKITINSVTEIQSNAFNHCSNLKELTINSGLTAIPDSAFYSCYSLEKIVLPQTLTSFGNNAFKSCSKLASITIPDSVTTIGNYCFEYCASLTGIIIPMNVTSMGYSAFDGCNSLTVYCEASSQPGGWNDGWNGYFSPPIFIKEISY